MRYGFTHGYAGFSLRGFPHSDIHGSMLACSSPWLFAAYHVLRRLPVPRHSPFALRSLTYLHCIALLQKSIALLCLVFSYHVVFKEQVCCWGLAGGDEEI